MAYQPIRWDNVPGSSLSEASRPLDAAARAFDMGFGAIHNVLDQRSAIQDQNFAAGRTNATNTVMNRLMGVDSVDGFKAAKQGLGAELDGYGAGIDQQAIRNFADQRTGVLQDRAIKDIDFNHKTLDEAQAKDRDRIQGMLASGDKAQIDSAMKELPGMDLRVKADLYRSGNDAQRQLIDRAHADQRHEWDGQKVHADIAHMANQDKIGFGNLEVSRGQLDVSRGNLEVNRANAMMTLDDRLEQRDSKLRAEMANTFKNEAGSLAGQAVIEDAIASIKDPDDQKQARIAASEILKKNPKSSTNSVVMSIKGIDASWAIDILERSAAARSAAKMDANGAGGQDAEYAAKLRDTLQAKIAMNQQRRDALATGGFGLGDRGTGGRGAPAAGGAVLQPGQTVQTGNGPVTWNPPAEGTPPAYTADDFSASVRRREAERGTYGSNGFVPAGAAPAPQAQAQAAAPATPAIPSPAQDRYASMMQSLGGGGSGPKPTSADMYVARQAANDEARQQYLAQEQAKKDAAKVEMKARVEDANRKNAEWMTRQTALNNSARDAAVAKQAANKEQDRQDRISTLQSNIAMYEKRKGIGDATDLADAKEELAKLQRR